MSDKEKPLTPNQPNPGDGIISKGETKKVAKPAYVPSHTGHLQEPFLDEYKKCESIMLACKKVGVSPWAVRQWRLHDEEFSTKFTQAHLEAQEQNNDTLKSNAIQLAQSGNPHWAIDKRTGNYLTDANGQRVVMYREFYPNLTMFMLKNRLPDEFKDKFEYEINAQLIVTLASEFLSIVRRHVAPTVATSIQKELETLSAKLATA